MKNALYLTNQEVVIDSTKDVKKILEFENICDIWIYYMTDGTSYAESQIYSDLDNYNRVKNIILSAENKISDIIDFEKVAENMTKWYKSNKRNS